MAMSPKANPGAGAPSDHGGKDAASAARDSCGGLVSLTPARRRILEILASESRPLGAYEMIDKVAAATGKRPAPISIYRALDFLLENHLIHRLASRNAYLACRFSHDAREPIVFLICESCGAVAEAASPAMCGALGELVTQANFTPRAQVLEVAGRCKACAAA